MKILIAEDDFVSRKFLFRFLERYGKCDLVIDGVEALDAVLISMQEKEPYDLICLDIMMPKLDGIRVLQSIRSFEKQQQEEKEEEVKPHRAIVVMTTALSDTELVQEAFKHGCDAYAAKPLDTKKMIEALDKFQLI